jgi:hypothetical protein
LISSKHSRLRPDLSDIVAGRSRAERQDLALDHSFERPIGDRLQRDEHSKIQGRDQGLYVSGALITLFLIVVTGWTAIH